VTTDGFFLSIAADDPKFDESATPKLIESFGATAVEVCREETTGRDLPRALRRGLIIAAVLAVLPPLLIALGRQGKSDKPRLHPILDMDFQPKYKPQSASAFFSDRRTMRPPVAGTVAVGNLNADEHFYLGYRVRQTPEREPKGGNEKNEPEYCTTFPPQVLERSKELMDRGQGRFNVYCATCHGLVGDGNGMTSVRAREQIERNPDWVTPTSIHAAAIRRQPVGRLFNTITHGAGKMPAYAAQIPVEDRWAIVLYVRALQRSQNASIEDVPKDVRPQLR